MNSFIRTAERTADRTLSSLVDSGAYAHRLINSLRAIEAQGVDSLLGRVGLRRRAGALGPAVWFAVGALTAGAVVVLLAPGPGKKIRGRMVQLWKAQSDKRAKPPASVATAIPAGNGAREELAHHRV
jgi:hypothetical protein